VKNLEEKIKNKTARVCVIGMGYVGLPLSILIAKSGFKTFGGEIDKKKIDTINSGRSPLSDLKEINEKDIENLIKTQQLIISEPERSSVNTDIKIICVQTPMFTDRRPDLTAVKSAAKIIGKTLEANDLVINESTVAPGMTKKVIGEILEEESGLKLGEEFYLVASPERIDPGNVTYTIDKIPKIIGGINKESTLLGKLFYSNFIKGVVEVSSLETAEATKMLENSYRALNIGFINEFAKFCDVNGINVLEVINAASTKPIAFQPHYPGIGVGGSCIPKDPYYLISAGEEVGVGFPTLLNATVSNESMPYYTFHVLKKLCNSNGIKMENAKITLFGISYKGNVRDLRDSPALVFHNILKREKLNVSVYDPFFSDEEIKNMEFVPFNPQEDECDIIIVGCDHSQFKTFDYKKIRGLKLIIDGKNVLPKLHIPVIGIGARN
jgi:UDP-N-acetyl-D-glucosamine dehydrogenase